VTKLVTDMSKQLLYGTKSVVKNLESDAMTTLADGHSMRLIDPIQNKYARLDLVFLFLLQGNDYLPKLRGITFSKALRAYTKVLSAESTAQNASLIVDLENKTFNLAVLVKFLEFLSYEEGLVSSPIHNIPTATEAFRTHLQKL